MEFKGERIYLIYLGCDYLLGFRFFEFDDIVIFLLFRFWLIFFLSSFSFVVSNYCVVWFVFSINIVIFVIYLYFSFSLNCCFEFLREKRLKVKCLGNLVYEV